MRAGYKVDNLMYAGHKVVVVSNLPLANEVFNFSEENEKEAKKQKDGYDIGFWRIKSKVNNLCLLVKPCGY